MTLETIKKAGMPVFAYGNFLVISINSVILALTIFVLVRWINKLKHAEAAAPTPAPAEEVKLLREIRDSLKPG